VNVINREASEMASTEEETAPQKNAVVSEDYIPPQGMNRKTLVPNNVENILFSAKWTLLKKSPA